MDYIYDHFDIMDIVETNICPTITIAVYNIRLYLVLYLAFRASSSDHSQLQSDVGNSDASQITGELKTLTPSPRTTLRTTPRTTLRTTPRTTPRTTLRTTPTDYPK